MSDGTADRVRERVLADHRSLLAATGPAADAVAEALNAPITDGRALADALEAELADRDLLSEYTSVLETAAAAAAVHPPTRPVAAPPYVVVTSRGPMVRVTDDRARLVLTVRTFDIRSDPRRRYARRRTPTVDSIDVSLTKL